jgi:phosphoheptose isomerase
MLSGKKANLFKIIEIKNQKYLKTMAEIDWHIETLCKNYPLIASVRNSVKETAEIIINCFTNGNKLLVCGNGGSSADSDHFAAELMKSFELQRPLESSVKKRLSAISNERGTILGEKLNHSLPVISMTSNNALITAISNDMDPAMIFAQQIIGYGNEGDVLIGISTSGNSANIVDACITAKAINLPIIGITGKTGGKMKQYCTVLINVPERNTALIQELQLPVLHTLCRIVEDHFYGDKI